MFKWFFAKRKSLDCEMPKKVSRFCPSFGFTASMLSFIFFDFYLNATINTAMSAGDTPDILDA